MENQVADFLSRAVYAVQASKRGHVPAELARQEGMRVRAVHFAMLALDRGESRPSKPSRTILRPSEPSKGRTARPSLVHERPPRLVLDAHPTLVAFSDASDSASESISSKRKREVEEVHDGRTLKLPSFSPGEGEKPEARAVPCFPLRAEEDKLEQSVVVEQKTESSVEKKDWLVLSEEEKRQVRAWFIPGLESWRNRLRSDPGLGPFIKYLSDDPTLLPRETKPEFSALATRVAIDNGGFAGSEDGGEGW